MQPSNRRSISFIQSCQYDLTQLNNMAWKQLRGKDLYLNFLWIRIHLL